METQVSVAFKVPVQTLMKSAWLMEHAKVHIIITTNSKSFQLWLILLNVGLSLSYSFTYAAQLQITGNCGGTYDVGESSITTPNYPNEYPLGKRCHWNIEVPKGQYIELEFKHFDLGPDITCNFEWLQIHNGKSSLYPLATKKLCSNSKPENVISGGTKLFLRWKSDDFRSFSGFNISIKFPGK